MDNRKRPSVKTTEIINCKKPTDEQAKMVNKLQAEAEKHGRYIAWVIFK